MEYFFRKLWCLVACFSVACHYDECHYDKRCARYQKGDNTQVVWTEFATLRKAKLVGFMVSAWHTYGFLHSWKLCQGLVLFAKVFPCVKRRHAECHVTEFRYAECHYCVCHVAVLTGPFASLSALGNCDIHAEQKISFTNETKWNEIWLGPEGWVQKIYLTLLPNFGKGYNKSCKKFHLFCIAWTKVSEMQQIVFCIQLFISFISHMKQ